MEQIAADLNNLTQKLQKSTKSEYPLKNTDLLSEVQEPEKGSPEWVTERLQRLNISTLKHTFDSFKADRITMPAKKTMLEVASGESSKRFVLLSGITGSGKTHLVEATIIAWAKRGIQVKYRTFSEIARSLKNELRRGGEYYDITFKALCETQYLIIDDIGMGTTESRFEMSDLEDMIDMRYRKRFYPNLDLYTIIVTNKDDLPERIVSRFSDPEVGIVLYMGDKDYRRRKVE